LTLLEQDLSAMLRAADARTSSFVPVSEAGDLSGVPAAAFPSAVSAGVFIKARGPGMVFALRGAILRSTCGTRARTLCCTPGCRGCRWLDEGLAEYFEVARDQRLKLNPHLPVVQGASPIR
jgi:hypothetical protein